VILCAHLGRPKGKPNPKYSLRPIVDRLRVMLDHSIGEQVNVAFAPDCVGELAHELSNKLEDGKVLLLENLRFYPQEEANDPGFARKLASLCQIYVNDAFGSAHRAHASTEGITHFTKHAVAGLLMEKELNYLGKALIDPARPFIAILGGAKVSDKIEVIDHLIGKVDAILIGGGMAYTFLKALGEQVGKSLVEEDKLELARQLLQEAKTRKLKLLLPVDHVAAEKIDMNARITRVDQGQPIPANLMALDIGPKTIEMFDEEIARARTILWNGPMGVFEVSPFARGTFQIARAVADNPGALSIVGGGDSVSAVRAAGVAEKITHISTGGGASLEFLEGKKLPGVEALTDKR
jgi:phosphoglycerate kinase